MERRAYSELLDWKQRGGQKPYLLIGARQTGKTYLVEEFLAREYEQHLTFTLTERPDIVSLFAEAIPTQAKLDRLELIVGHTIDWGRTAIFFDEAQVSEEVLTACKFFAESAVPYQVICAGSLLGVKVNRFSGSFPVGKVEFHYLNPMTFEEYLWALGRRALADEIRAHVASGEKMSEPVHELCLDLLRGYLACGGMPEAVANLVEGGGKVLNLNRRIIADIHTSYLADMSKYVNSGVESTRIEAVYRSVPSQLGNPSRKFQYAHVTAGARSREYDGALNWLVASGMVFRCNMVSTAAAPLNAHEKPGNFKLFLNDVGILNDVLGVHLANIALDGDYRAKEAIFENYVATHLVAAGHTLHYWRGSQTHEIDFLLDLPVGVIPVEVKAGTTVSSPSLRAYVKQNQPPYSIRISSRNFGYENSIKSIPLYAAFCLETDLITPATAPVHAITHTGSLGGRADALLSEDRADQWA